MKTPEKKPISVSKDSKVVAVKKAESTKKSASKPKRTYIDDEDDDDDFFPMDNNFGALDGLDDLDIDDKF